MNYDDLINSVEFQPYKCVKCSETSHHADCPVHGWFICSRDEYRALKNQVEIYRTRTHERGKDNRILIKESATFAQDATYAEQQLAIAKALLFRAQPVCNAHPYSRETLGPDINSYLEGVSPRPIKPRAEVKEK